MRSSLAGRMNPEYKIVAFVGASGSGKSTLIERMVQDDLSLSRMMSVTTRPPSERDLSSGEEYEFVSTEEFERREAEGLFAWTTPKLHGNRYGTLLSTIREALERDTPTLMHLEPKSVPVLMECAGDAVALVFITVPYWLLRNRLIHRPDHTLSEDQVRERLNTCLEWESQARLSKQPYLFIANEGRVEQVVTTVINQLKGPSVRKIRSLPQLVKR